MLLHFVVISLFHERHAFDAKLGPKDPDLAHKSIAETLRLAGVKASKPRDPMWYLTLDNKFVGYVKVFREERYARNWFRDLREKEASRNIWAYWRDGYPLALVQGANVKDANQFVTSIVICRVRAFSAQSAAENGWKNWISGNLTAIEDYFDKSRGRATDESAKPETTVVRQPSSQNTDKRSTAASQSVESSAWQVTRGNSGIEGPRPSEEITRTYLLSRPAPPERTATLRIVCKLESEGLEGDLESEIGGLRLHRQLHFYLRPFQLPHDAAFVMGLSTVDQLKGGEFDVLASPVDRDTSVFAKFGGRNDVRTCLDVMMSGDDMIFTVSDDTESLVNFRLPNDSEFKKLVDEACDRLARTEVTYQIMRSQLR